MIYTLTLSPALDYQFICNSIRVGEINKGSNASYSVGGKGINVSRFLLNVGEKSYALGFKGGFAGKIISDFLDDNDIGNGLIQIDGNTRINVKINGNKETAFNLDGPFLAKEDVDLLAKKLGKIQEDDILVLSGSVGQLHNDIYKKIIELVSKNGVKCYLDASGEALKEGVLSAPYLIKPNQSEFCELIGKKISSLEDFKSEARKICKDYNIHYVLLSLGKNGALLVTQNDSIYQETIKNNITVRSTVAAGDTTLGAFIYKKSQDVSDEEALRYAVAAGCACVYKGAIPLKEDVDGVLDNI